MEKDSEQLNSSSEQEETEDLASQNEDNEDTNSERGADDSEKSQESPDLEKNNKQLYARASKAERELKTLRAELESYKKTSQKDEADPFETIRTVNALKDFQDEKELEIVRRQARALDVSLAEAAKHEDTQVLVDSYRSKKQNEEATPEPSSRGSGPKEKSFKDWTPDDINSRVDDGSPEALAEVDEYYKWAKQN